MLVPWIVAVVSVPPLMLSFSVLPVATNVPR